MNSITAATVFVVIIIVGLLNAVTFLVFAWDKYSARRNIWRIPERQLLGLALIGGSPAAFAASHILRHKTSKQPFRTYLKLIALFQVILIIALCIPQVRATLATLIKSI